MIEWEIVCPQGNRECTNKNCTCDPCICGTKTEDTDYEPQCTE